MAIVVKCGPDRSWIDRINDGDKLCQPKTLTSAMVAFSSFLWLHKLCTCKCAALRTVETIKIALTAQCDACGRDCAHAKQLQDLIGIIARLNQAASDIALALEGTRPSGEARAKLDEAVDVTTATCSDVERTARTGVRRDSEPRQLFERWKASCEGEGLQLYRLLLESSRQLARREIRQQAGIADLDKTDLLLDLMCCYGLVTSTSGDDDDYYQVAGEMFATWLRDKAG